MNESGEISKIIQLHFSKLPQSDIDFLKIDQKPDFQAEILHSSDQTLYNKYKEKLLNFEYILIKSSPDPPQNSFETANLTNSLNLPHQNHKNSTILPENTKNLQISESKILEKTNIFEVSLEPSYKEQSLTSKRLSILAKKSLFTLNKLENLALESSLNKSSHKRSYSKERIEPFTPNDKSSRKRPKSQQIREEFPNNSTILTTMKYFKTSEEIRKLVNEKYKKLTLEENSPVSQQMQNLDDFFAKKINEVLLKKCKNRPINDVKVTYEEYLRDEDFDKKEFDFSKKMLRHKKSYSMGKIKSEILTDKEERDQLNFQHPRREIRLEIKDLLTKNLILNKIHEKKNAQEEEKTNNFSMKLCERSSVMLQNKSKKMQKSIIASQFFDKNQEKSEGSKEKFQSLITTFEFNQMIDVQRTNSLIKKGKNSEHRNSQSLGVLKKTRKEESSEFLQKNHENTKEIIQKMAENVYRDMENCDKIIVDLKKNEFGNEKRKRKIERELIAKRSHYVKMNGDLSKTVKNLAMQKEVFGNFQNQINSMVASKLGRRQSSIIHPIFLAKLQRNDKE